MQSDEHLYDLTVVGGGPVGMFAAMYAGMRNLDTQLIESLPELGGQVEALYPEKTIHDIAGFVSGKGSELIANLKQQLAEVQDQVSIHLSEEVIGLEKQADGTFILTTSKRTTHTKTILISVGSGAFTPRQLACDYDHALDGKQVRYFVKRLADFAGKNVAVAGGGDAAIDWALALEPIANHVSIIHRRNNFRGLESSVAQLQQSSVELVTPFNITGVTAQGEGVQIELQENKGDTAKSLTADTLLVNYGFIADNHLLKDWGLELERRALVVNEFMMSSEPGIYGIGDASTYPGKVKLISSGFGEAPAAINHISTELYPDRRQPLHSTSM
ncbi:NAD(P)/FAD-dependent oxidoreductase [Secundilactobacillus similis DSM 23365 = JCM 2765]|uniref:Ferredoxin--NADP reductase n=1 Tax=Secundilactobacillus similis DSM 23365 = JCM 2765 TaxID=1423804 RepID=A0A0R2FD90_9LACO|nr:NAD(P)/FAD-dependent oxidoreductase [Secundilactobacillus similis]KRN26408.1 thioredoxin reductase [Secundilactobacillus similis DSM 23365 = JCM 2765]